MEGWIKLHRKIQDSYLWKNKPFSWGTAWVDMLLLANHKDSKCWIDGKLKPIQRGQFVTSIATLSERWGWDRKKTSKFLNVLETDEMIIQNRTTHGITVTIENYGFYQNWGTTDTPTDGQPLPQPMDNHGTADGQPMGQPLPTNKNDKNIKNEKKEKNDKNARIVYFPNDEKLDAAFADFVKMRKEIKKPMTDRAIELAIKRLGDLSQNPITGTMDNDLAIQIINQSIMNSWQSLFPIRDGDNNAWGGKGRRNIIQELMDC